MNNSDIEEKLEVVSFDIASGNIAKANFPEEELPSPYLKLQLDKQSCSIWSLDKYTVAKKAEETDALKESRG